MPLNYDTRVFPTSKAQWEELFDSVYGSRNTDELNALEWKEQVDLSSAEDLFEKIGRVALSMVNRDPDEASGYFEGRAILLAGLSAGKALGVKQVDRNIFEPMLRRFVGEDVMTKLDIQYRSYKAVSVFVMIVEPPKYGDPIYVLKQDLRPSTVPARTKVRTAGSVFVRKNTSSHIATQDELNFLAERKAKVGARIHLDANSSFAVVADFSQAEIANIIRSEERRLTSSSSYIKASKLSGGFDPYGLGKTLSSLQTAGTPFGENRSLIAYKAEVKNYLANLKVGLEGSFFEAASVSAPRVRLQINNPTNLYHQEVELRLEVKKPLLALEPKLLEDIDLEEILPKAPRLFGDSTSLIAGILNAPPLRPLYKREPTIVVEESAVKFYLKNLRPSETVSLNEIVILTSTVGVDPLELNWKFTSSNMHDMLTGVLKLEITPEPFSMSDTLSSFVKKNSAF